jgi:phage anti-repressor protein
MSFTKDNALSLMQSSETNAFPVDFDLAWRWLGYSRKDSALRTLLSAGFSETTDFHISEGISGTKPYKVYSLSIECLKTWAMMSQTAQGKLVRTYFLECEKIAKAASKPMTAVELLVQQANAMLAIERQQMEMNLTLMSHESRLESVEYHTKGHDDYMSLKAYCNVNGIDMKKFNPSVTAKLIVKYCGEQNAEVKRVADAKYGQINAYPVYILDAYFAQ